MTMIQSEVYTVHIDTMTHTHTHTCKHAMENHRKAREVKLEVE